MKWRVNLGSTVYEVDLPETLPEGLPFAAEVGGETYRLCFEGGHLRVLGEADVERPLRLRHQRFERRADASEIEAKVECWQPIDGTLRIEARVERHLPGSEGRRSSVKAKGSSLRSDITGKVIDVPVQEGQSVAEDTVLLVIEAMKMENKIFARAPGIVKKIHVKAGDLVKTGAPLIDIGAGE